MKTSSVSSFGLFLMVPLASLAQSFHGGVPPTTEKNVWMGKPVSELIAQVGEPDVKMPGPLLAQYYELWMKNDKYADESFYGAYNNGMGYTISADGEVLDNDCYHYPKLKNRDGFFDAKICVAVDDAGVIGGYTVNTKCGVIPRVFNDWVDGTLPPECIRSEAHE